MYDIKLKKRRSQEHAQMAQEEIERNQHCLLLLGYDRGESHVSLLVSINTFEKHLSALIYTTTAHLITYEQT